MRKIAVLVAALMLSSATVVPAQAATAGQRCTTLLAVAKSGSAKLYCGKNLNKRTAKARPLVWKKNVDCYDLLGDYAKVKRDYDSAVKQIADIKAQIASISGDTTALQASVKSLEQTVLIFEPIVRSLRGQVTALCS